MKNKAMDRQEMLATILDEYNLIISNYIDENNYEGLGRAVADRYNELNEIWEKDLRCQK